MCVRKCCKLGYKLHLAVNVTEGDTCVISDNSNFSITTYEGIELWKNSNDRLTYFFGPMNCEKGFVHLEPEINEKDKFYIQYDGKMWLPGYKISYGAKFYCIDFSDTYETLVGFNCYFEQSNEGLSRVICMIISMPFLLITFLVYATLPDRNIHGKALMSYVMSLLLAYIFLVSISLTPDFTDVTCHALAYVCYFFFLASFFWMNVMCIDIWWTFSRMYVLAAGRLETKKRFILFSCYAWGVPLIFLIILATINSTLDASSTFHPQVGLEMCWIKNGLPLLIYFYGIIGLIITFNVVLFILTAFKILQVKRATAVLTREDSKRHGYENEQQRFNLYLKLLLAMGLNWSMEIISWVFEWKVQSVPTWVWIVTDTCNALYGVFIFFIFVFKKNIWKHLQKRYYTFTGRSIMAQNLANGWWNSTRITSQMSRTESTPL